VNRYAQRTSLPALAVSAVIALSLAGGVATLFQSRAGIAEPSVYTLAARRAAPPSAAPEATGPIRVDVLAEREPPPTTESDLRTGDEKRS
jgi:hypothetical protein